MCSLSVSNEKLFCSLRAGFYASKAGVQRIASRQGLSSVLHVKVYQLQIQNLGHHWLFRGIQHWIAARDEGIMGENVLSYHVAVIR